MRLTLRTLLAYMDEILEPDDRADIGKKIEESDFASGLMNRIRDTMRRLRLGAPKLWGKGIALDPNTVAEYLDNTLPSERVTEFERVCLESDIHLAEVGSCHQILTLVLGEPAEVDPEMRRRMYRIGTLADEPVQAAAVPSPPPLPVEAPVVAASEPQSYVRRKPEVPDYLRESSRMRFWPIAVAILVLLGLLVAGARAVAPLDRNHPIAKALGLAPTDAEVAAAQDPPLAPRSPSSAVPSSAAQPTGDASQEDSAGDEAPAPVPVSPPVDPAEIPDAPLPDDELPVDDPVAVTPGAVAPNEQDIPPQTLPEPGVGGDKEAMPVDPSAPAASGVATTVIPPRFADGFLPSAPVTDPTTEDLGSTAPEAPAAAADGDANAPASTSDVASRVGLLVSDQDVVVIRWDPTDGDWQRVKPLSRFNDGDRLLTLPTYRAKIQLPADLMLQVSGGSLVQLQATDTGGAPGIQLPYGRIIVLGLGMNGSNLRLDLGGQIGTARFKDPESKLAIQVQRVLVAGEDPEVVPSVSVVELYVDSGEVEWVGVDGQSQVLKGPARLILGATELSEVDPKQPVKMPAWVASENTLPSEARASAVFAQAMKPETSAALALKELGSGPQIERVLLATRSLALLDVFEPSIDGLSDSTHRAYWQSHHIDSLRAGLARGAESATKVREALVRRRSSDGAQLYRMLWGYTTEQLRGGEAAKLIEYLNHPALDFRVLAHDNLRAALGTPRGTSQYQPEESPQNRQQAVRVWLERLQSGRLFPETGKNEPAQPGSVSPAT